MATCFAMVQQEVRHLIVIHLICMYHRWPKLDKELYSLLTSVLSYNLLYVICIFMARICKGREIEPKIAKNYS